MRDPRPILTGTGSGDPPMTLTEIRSHDGLECLGRAGEAFPEWPEGARAMTIEYLNPDRVERWDSDSCPSGLSPAQLKLVRPSPEGSVRLAVGSSEITLAQCRWFFPAEPLRRRLDDVDADDLRRRIEDADHERRYR